MSLKKDFLHAALHTLKRLEPMLPRAVDSPDWSRHYMARWVSARPHSGHLCAEPGVPALTLQDLLGIDAQKRAAESNIRQFLAGLPANDMLLWGPRGTGKSSLIRALVGSFHTQNLRAVEVDRLDLEQLPEIADAIGDQRHRFLIFCDDLTFEAQDSAYKALKSILDGGLYRRPQNLLICATSNRRHLLPEYANDNLGTEVSGTELHYAEGIEEKISLSDRFGLWLPFHPFDQVTYLRIVAHWLEHLGYPGDIANEASYRAEALRYALARGGRSGRAAWHFARQFAGAAQLEAAAIQSEADPT